MLREQTQTHIRGLSDEDLLAYIRVGVAEYEPDAIAFAQEEFRRRNLETDRVEAVVKAVDLREAVASATAALAAKHSLGALGKTLSFISGLFLFSIFIVFVFLASTRLKDRGEFKKARDVWTWFGFGAATTFLAAILSAVISHGVRR